MALKLDLVNGGENHHTALASWAGHHDTDNCPLFYRDHARPGVTPRPVDIRSVVMIPGELAEGEVFAAHNALHPKEIHTKGYPDRNEVFPETQVGRVANGEDGLVSDLDLHDRPIISLVVVHVPTVVILARANLEAAFEQGGFEERPVILGNQEVCSFEVIPQKAMPGTEEKGVRVIRVVGRGGTYRIHSPSATNIDGPGCALDLCEQLLVPSESGDRQKEEQTH